MAKLDFKQLLPLSLLSHDPSEIILICWFGAQKYVLLLSMLDTLVLLQIYVEVVIVLFLKVQKNSIYLKYKYHFWLV